MKRLSELRTKEDYIKYLIQCRDKSFYKSVKVWQDWQATCIRNRAGSFKSISKVEELRNRNVTFTIIDDGVVAISYHDEIVLWSHKNLDRCIKGDNKFRIDFLI